MIVNHLKDCSLEIFTCVHLVIDLNELEDKNLKTIFRTRLIPIHKVWIDLGLIDRVQSILTAGEKKLFPTTYETLFFYIAQKVIGGVNIAMMQALQIQTLSFIHLNMLKQLR